METALIDVIKKWRGEFSQKEKFDHAKAGADAADEILSQIEADRKGDKAQPKTQ